jgi:hypothetical protein
MRLLQRLLERRKTRSPLLFEAAVRSDRLDGRAETSASVFRQLSDRW